MNYLGVCRWSAHVHLPFVCCGQVGFLLLTIPAVYQFVLKVVAGSRHHGVM